MSPFPSDDVKGSRICTAPRKQLDKDKEKSHGFTVCLIAPLGRPGHSRRISNFRESQNAGWGGRTQSPQLWEGFRTTSPLSGENPLRESRLSTSAQWPHPNTDWVPISKCYALCFSPTILPGCVSAHFSSRASVLHLSSSYR